MTRRLLASIMLALSCTPKETQPPQDKKSCQSDEDCPDYMRCIETTEVCLDADKVISAREPRRPEPEQELFAEQETEAAKKPHINAQGGAEFSAGSAVFYVYPSLSIHRCIGDGVAKQMCVPPGSSEWYVIAAFSVENVTGSGAIFDTSKIMLISQGGKEASPVPEIERAYPAVKAQGAPGGDYIFAGTRSENFEVPARRKVMAATVFRMSRDLLSGPVVLRLPVLDGGSAVNVAMDQPKFFWDGLRGEEIRNADGLYVVAESIAWSRCVMGVKARPLTCAEEGKKFLQFVLIVVDAAKQYIYHPSKVRLADGAGRVYEPVQVPVEGAPTPKRRKGEVIITEGVGDVKIKPGERHALVITFRTDGKMEKPLLIEIPTLSEDRLLKIAVDKIDADVIAPFGPTSAEYDSARMDEVFQGAIKKSTSTTVPQSSCCKSCANSKPCGAGCISYSKQCHLPPGCAC